MLANLKASFQGYFCVITVSLRMSMSFHFNNKALNSNYLWAQLHSCSKISPLPHFSCTPISLTPSPQNCFWVLGNTWEWHLRGLQQEWKTAQIGGKNHCRFPVLLQLPASPHYLPLWRRAEVETGSGESPNPEVQLWLQYFRSNPFCFLMGMSDNHSFQILFILKCIACALWLWMRPSGWPI